MQFKDLKPGTVFSFADKGMTYITTSKTSYTPYNSETRSYTKAPAWQMWTQQETLVYEATSNFR